MTTSATLAAETQRPLSETKVVAKSPTQTFFWSLRRELWEHPSIYVAALAVGGLVLFGFIVSTWVLARHIRLADALGPSGQGSAFSAPYDFAAMAIFATQILVGLFYCLGALHGERRDRTILFWKSLPVSDLTTVAAKAFIPMVVLPIVTVAITVAVHGVMGAVSTLVLLLNGINPGILWAQVPLVQSDVVLLYAVAIFALWYAPVYGWLLLVSGWAKRAPFLWAILPPLALCLVEKLAFNTTYFGGVLKERLGGFWQGFSTGAFVRSTDRWTGGDPLSTLDPARFFSAPGLWMGLLAAAALFAAAVWLRRRREPI